EALLAARSNICLTYNCRELQKDQELQPCGTLTQLRRYLEQQVLGGASFRFADMPLRGDDPRYLDSTPEPHTDLLVNYNASERLLAVAARAPELELTAEQHRMLQQRLSSASRSFEVPSPAGGGAANRQASATITLRELRVFLHCPAEAALKRHLA